MHRTIEMSVPSSCTDGLLAQFVALADVIGVSVQRGASVKPVGDIITVQTLNRGADDVLQCIAALPQADEVSIVTAETASMIDPRHQSSISRDVDEAIWEEMETGLRHQGRVTVNYIALMALGGSIATVGLVSEPVPQAIAFVSSAVIAPGFEPIAKIPLGLVLRRGEVLRNGFVSVLIGYAVLVMAAAITFALLLASGTTTLETLIENPEVKKIADPTWLEISVSICGAVAGIVMIAAYRRSVIAGPLIALILIPAAALIGAALVGGRADLAGQGLERLLLDIALIVGLGGLVIAGKQALVHQRQPLI